MDRYEIEQFLFHEALLMDEHRYDDWLKLWGPDAIYWIPCAHEDENPARAVSIIYDRRQRLEDRIARLKSGDVMAMDPLPRIRRVLSNISITESGSTYRTSSNFLLVQAHGSEQRLWCGRSLHLLKLINGEIKISEKKVLLVNSEQEMPALQFLI